MNKKQLMAQLSGSSNLSKADDERTFDIITNTILDALKGDDSVKIAGFGTYKVAKRKARVGRNPRTGEQIQIAASQKVKFLPAKALKDNQQKKFQEDYKKWYLETEIGKEFPLGEPRLKAEAAIKDADEAVSEVTEQLV